MEKKLQDDQIKTIVISYSCDVCLGAIPIEYRVQWVDKVLVLNTPRLVERARVPFDFSHVPVVVREEIEEALDCLSVSAFSGFAALCRRSVQAICADLGADATTRVKKQFTEMIELAGLDDEWNELVFQVVLTGHDGAHPHLPDVSAERANVLLSLVQDLTYELYSRPGKVREAAQLRQASKT